MLPLPVPERGGSIEVLQSFLNLSNQNDFVLVVAWLLAALRSSGPYPLVAIFGEQGSAKTVLSKLLRALIDPNAAPVRALPREERELMIAANNGHLLAFDNLSGLPPWLSDALCRLASGGSFAVRSSTATMRRYCFKAAHTLLNARALAGHLRRAQTFLRALGIDIAFSREGRAGKRVIRMRTSVENTVSTVSSVRDGGLELNRVVLSEIADDPVGIEPDH
jgi:hypothetical protein